MENRHESSDIDSALGPDKLLDSADAIQSDQLGPQPIKDNGSVGKELP